MSIVDNIYQHCLSGPFQGDLTAQNISLYHTSPFTIYCEKFVSAKEKDPMSPYRELILERGLQHEQRVIERKYPECRTIEFEMPEEGFRTILEEMAKGRGVICGLPLLLLPENMQGKIDVLERRNDGSSVFGNYYYLVTEIKLVKKIRREHILQAAFYTYMLSKVQEYMPHIFRLINHDFRVFEYSFADYETALQSALKGTRAILDGREVPTATYNASEWPWERYGNHEAIRMRDVSLVGQVGPKTKQKLIDRGFKKIWDVAYARLDELRKIPGINETNAKKLIVSAQAIMKNAPICIDSSALQFPAKPTEIFLDLEGTDQPDAEGEIEPVDYLIGVIVCKEGFDAYHSFVAHRMHDEEKMFREFLSFLKAQNDYIIYHWHNYEHWHIKRLAERYHFIEEAEALILPYMIDLHRMATKAFAFPTYTNGLKDVAAFLGFRWRHDDMNALDAIAYYLKYQTEPDTYRNKIQAIIDYNEDDCRATKRIKDWLQERSASGI
jgi:uncharacterized protein